MGIQKKDIKIRLSPTAFVFGTSSQRLRRTAQAASPASSSSTFPSSSTLSVSPVLSDTSSSPFQYSSGDSLPVTPDMEMHGSPRPSMAAFDSPCPVRRRQLPSMQPRPIHPHRFSMYASDYESEDSDSEDFEQFLNAVPLPPSEKAQPSRSKQFANAVAKLTSPSLISLSLGKMSPLASQKQSRPAAPSSPSPMYLNRRAVATTANIVLVQRDDVFDSRPAQPVAGPSSVAELHMLRANINALALSANRNTKSNNIKHIRRKAVPAYLPGQDSNTSAFSLATPALPSIGVSPRSSSLPSTPVIPIRVREEEMHGIKFDMVDMSAITLGSVSDHSFDTETACGYGHSRTKSTWSSSSSSMGGSGSSSDRESDIQTPPASAYDTSSRSMFAIQQASFRKQYTLEVAGLNRRSTRDLDISTFAEPPFIPSGKGPLNTTAKKSGFSLSFSSVSQKLRRKPAIKR